MFTGLIEHTGEVESVRSGDRTVRLVIRAPSLAADLSEGDSVAVNGVCLTVAARTEETFSVEAVDTTIARTTVGDWEVGRPLNLEPALRLGDELGGHLVQGHVDGTGRVSELEPVGAMKRLRVEVGEAIASVTVERGSLAIDGVSLTVAGLADGIAEFAIIPYTWSRTSLGDLEPGARVNVEADVIGKYVARFVEPYRAALRPETASPGQ